MHKHQLIATMNNYKIAYKGLSEGVHDFTFEVDGALFEAFENSEILGADCRATVQLQRGASQLIADVQIEGEVVVACDRCLEDCALPIDYEGQLVVKFSDEEQEYDGEVLWLFPGEPELDLAQYIYESVILSLPYQRVHAEGECNPEMLERFSIVSEGEFSAIEAEAAREEEQQAVKGEAWEKLAALKAQMEQED